jgi:hypothetical protein
MWHEDPIRMPLQNIPLHVTRTTIPMNPMLLPGAHRSLTELA